MFIRSIQMNDKCFNCGNFEAYYSKAYCRFVPTEWGYCTKHKDHKHKFCFCENWKLRRYPKFNSHLFLIELESALMQINGIKLILDELEKQNEIKK